MDSNEVQNLKREIESLKRRMAETEDALRAVIEQLTAKKLVRFPG